MAEHPPRHAASHPPRPTRTGERRPIPRKVDRPTPAPIDISVDPRPHSGARRRPTPRRRRWLRAARRGLRSKRGRWVLAALACLLVLLVGLLSQGFLSSPAPSAAPPAGQRSSGPALGALPPASPTRSATAKASKTAAGGSDQQVLRTLKSQFPDNPLNHLRGAAIHHVTVEARSRSGIPLVGWLVPTGLGDTYGVKRNATANWTLTQRAVGKGYLAAVFVQAGRGGDPVTCRVIVDGKVTSSESTAGSSGRAVCLG